MNEVNEVNELSEVPTTDERYDLTLTRAEVLGLIVALGHAHRDELSVISDAALRVADAAVRAQLQRQGYDQQLCDSAWFDALVSELPLDRCDES